MDIGRNHDNTSVDAALETDASLAAVREAIDRLNRTGICIRRSSTRPHTVAPITGVAGCEEFQKVSLIYVKAFYRLATPELQEYLSHCMTTRRNMIMVERYRHEERKVRPDAATPQAEPLAPIPEDEDPQLEVLIRVKQHATVSGHPSDHDIQPIAKSPIPQILVRPYSGSENSTIDSSLFKKRMASPSHGGSRSKGTMSIRISQVQYPPPPQPEGNDNYATCYWCCERHKHLSNPDSWMYVPIN